MQNLLENTIYLCQISELQKKGVDANFNEPHVLMSKLTRTNSKDCIQIFWLNELLLNIKKMNSSEEWVIYNATGEVILSYCPPTN